jgi:hypothetical protein
LVLSVNDSEYSKSTKTKNARFYGIQRTKHKVSFFFNGVLVTKVQPDGLGTQRRCLRAFGYTETQEAHAFGPRSVYSQVGDLQKL